MLLFRIATVFLLSLANLLTAVLGLALPVLALLLAQLWLPLELRDWPFIRDVAGLIESHSLTSSTSGIAAMVLMIWIAFGALFLKYQLHADRRVLAASRDHQSAVDANLRSIPDILFQTVFLLALGPLVLIVRTFQQPTYAYVSRARHYRDKLFYTAGRQSDLDPQARIVFDSKSYLLAQLLELLFWGGVFYLLLFENNIVTL
ncbi:hypothetical protein FF098_006870 [Parvularcula flava]|uniref:Uncharacterized protein n=1 Tax=Aquisalinus luteolus TaxID=1566827 RepID=A0A8J3A1H8_9PROT|nr:hypothetical protein [Aquisalinus luteolus]NHK27618.1 hypothetical protein [Aquisalinus luteolus]GGH95984.1 hypothetical protein GCM10011355_13820 [Aquisalinus luteolus]